MKKTKLFGLILSVIIVLIGACKKQPGDYRNPYLGNYDFTVQYSSFNMADSSYSTGTLYYYGEVKYGSTDNEISIHYLENSYINPVLNNDGTFSQNAYYPINGAFESTNKFTFGFYSGGHGGGTSYNVVGER